MVEPEKRQALQPPSPSGTIPSPRTEVLPWEQPIVWAIDALPEEEEMNLRTALCLQRLFPNSLIHPVYILSEESWGDRSPSLMRRPNLKPAAIDSLKAFLNQLPSLRLQKPRVLIEASSSNLGCAKKLLKYSKRIGAGLISVGSHDRHGLSRFFVGSFSEAILDHSTIPVIISGPHQNPLVTHPRVVVFPVDFSESSKEAFPEILSLTKYMGAELHLFHKQISLIDPMLQSGVSLMGGGWFSVETYMNETPENHQDEADAWIQRAESEGIHAVFRSENFREPTSQAIVEYVKSLDESAALLAMISHTSHLEAALLGSVTRDVIRLSPCPVYIAGRRTT
jgi:nucleotide-binding universal stress UspA family protein